MTRTIDKNLTSFLPQSVVQAQLDERGARFTKVTFMKKGGEITSRVGMPKVKTRRVGGEKGPEATEQNLARAATATKALRDNGNIWMDYPNPDHNDGKPGFSFNLGRVIAIGTEGEHVEIE